MSDFIIIITVGRLSRVQLSHFRFSPKPGSTSTAHAVHSAIKYKVKDAASCKLSTSKDREAVPLDSINYGCHLAVKVHFYL